MSMVRTAVVQGAVTAMALQPRTRRTFHSSNVLKLLVTIGGFENRTLRLNHPGHKLSAKYHHRSNMICIWKPHSQPFSSKLQKLPPLGNYPTTFPLP